MGWTGAYGPVFMSLVWECYCVLYCIVYDRNVFLGGGVGGLHTCFRPCGHVCVCKTMEAFMCTGNTRHTPALSLYGVKDNVCCDWLLTSKAQSFGFTAANDPRSPVQTCKSHRRTQCVVNTNKYELKPDTVLKPTGQWEKISSSREDRERFAALLKCKQHYTIHKKETRDLFHRHVDLKLHDHLFQRPSHREVQHMYFCASVSSIHFDSRMKIKHKTSFMFFRICTVVKAERKKSRKVFNYSNINMEMFGV